MIRLRYILPRILPFTRYLTDNTKIWSAIEAKMNKAPLEVILKPLIEFRQTNPPPLPPLYYELFFDLCTTDEEFDCVLSDMMDSRVAFPVKRLLNLDMEKLGKILSLTMEIRGCTFPQALGILLDPDYNVTLDSISDYIDGKLSFKFLYSHCKLSSSVTLLFKLLIKLHEFDKFASDFKSTLLRDDEGFDFAFFPKDARHLTEFFLHQLIHGYSSQVEFRDKVWRAFELTKINNEIRTGEIRFNFGLLVDLYEVCLHRNDMDMAAHVYRITNNYALEGNYRVKRSYYANLLHVHSILKVRKESSRAIRDTQTSQNIDYFLNFDLIKRFYTNFFLPTVDLFIALMHYQIANSLSPFDGKLYATFLQLTNAKKSSETSESLTSWTKYYTDKDSIPIDAYCNMLYTTVNFANKLRTPLTFGQVNDLLKHLKPDKIHLEGDRVKYLKGLTYFKNYILNTYPGAKLSFEMNYTLMNAFSRVNAFSHMKELYLRMCSDGTDVDMTMYSLLISAAIRQCLVSDCMYIIKEVSKDIQKCSQSMNIPNSIVEGLIECSCICREHTQAMLTIRNALIEKRELSIEIFKTFLSSCCKSNDVSAVKELTDTLSALEDERYRDILDTCSLKLESLESS